MKKKMKKNFFREMFIVNHLGGLYKKLAIKEEKEKVKRI